MHIAFSGVTVLVIAVVAYFLGHQAGLKSGRTKTLKEIEAMERRKVRDAGPV
jgi:hypothetical protein